MTALWRGLAKMPDDVREPLSLPLRGPAPSPAAQLLAQTPCYAGRYILNETWDYPRGNPVCHLTLSDGSFVTIEIKPGWL